MRLNFPGFRRANRCVDALISFYRRVLYHTSPRLCGEVRITSSAQKSRVLIPWGTGQIVPLLHIATTSAESYAAAMIFFASKADVLEVFAHFLSFLFQHCLFCCRAAKSDSIEGTIEHAGKIPPPQ